MLLSRRSCRGNPPLMFALLLLVSFVFAFLIVFERSLLMSSLNCQTPKQCHENCLDVDDEEQEWGQPKNTPSYTRRNGTLLPNQTEVGLVAKQERHHGYRISRKKLGQSAFSYYWVGIYPDTDCGNSNSSSFSGGIKEKSTQVDTAILYEFSPHVKHHVRQMFSEFVQPWFNVHASQVSCLPLRGVLNCALRVWLKPSPFQAGEKTQNRFQESNIYLLQLDHNLRYIPNSGRLIPIPAPVQQDIDKPGPEEPRLFHVDGELFLSFMMGHATPDGSNKKSGKLKKNQFIWSVDKNVLHGIRIQGSPKVRKVEQFWTPWVNDGGSRLNFVYQFTGKEFVRAMRCSFPPPVAPKPAKKDQSSASAIPANKVTCMTSTAVDEATTTLQPSSNGTDNGTSSSDILERTYLKGSSLVVHYSGDYYLALTYSMQPNYPDQAMAFATQLVLINSQTMKIVFLSAPLLIKPQVMAQVRTAAPTIGLPFLNVRSVFVEPGRNSIVLAAAVNDNECFLVRMRGIASLLSEAIESDKQIATLGTQCQEAYQGFYSAMEGWLKAKNLVALGEYFQERPEIEP